MPKEPFKIVQPKHCKTSSTPTHVSPSLERPVLDPGLLFVHRDPHNVQHSRSATESIAIRRHLSRRWQDTKPRKGRQQLDLHPSIGRILTKREEEQSASKESFPCDSTELNAHDAAISNTISFPGDFPLKRVEPPSPHDIAIANEVLDPFTSVQSSSREMRRLLYLYCKHIRPLARTVSNEWLWNESLPEIQASPMLTNAIAAYTSAFSTGILKGSRGLALPPITQRNQLPLWEYPAWFQYQAKAITLLNAALQDGHRKLDDDVFYTIVFLLRLAVLFGDGLSGSMHLKALTYIAKTQGKNPEVITRELMVTRINFVTLYLYKDALIKRKEVTAIDENPGNTIEPDRSQWHDVREWHKFEGMLFGRYLTWQARTPEAIPHEETKQTILRLNPEATKLPTDILTGLIKHYQIAQYLWSYLTNVSFDTSLPKVRLHVDELQNHLKQQYLRTCEQYIPRVVFFLLFVGAYASRGHIQRSWFTKRLANARIKVHYMRDIHVELSGFGDPVHCMPILLEEILIEIREARDGVHALTWKSDLYQGEPYLPVHGVIPLCRSPDLDTPLREIAGDTG